MGHPKAAVTALRHVVGAVLVPVLVLNLVAMVLLPSAASAADVAPLLVVYDASSSDHFGPYLQEILNSEGIKDYQVQPLSNLNSTLLSGRRAVLLGPASPTAAQVTALSTFVTNGGGLVAMQPAASLGSLLQISLQSGTTASGYMKITDANLGAGLYTDTMQYHGNANHYTLAGASQVARLYSNATTATSWPAVTLATSGAGTAAAFAYDLAQSVVLSRQGNPANADTDADGDGFFRTIDLFYGGWADLNRTAVPQADEQMHLLGRLVQTAMGMPIPRLWYFPSGAPTVVVATGDAHGNPDSYFQSEIDPMLQAGQPMTFYVAQASSPTKSDVDAWRAQGFDFSAHPYVDCGYQCGYQAAFNWLQSTFGISPKTVRTHMVRWSGWSTGASVEAQFGVQMDFNFYQWGSWVNTSSGAPALGYLGGSGQPMRFADANGNILPIFQQHTLLVDEELAPDIGLAGLTLSQAEAASKSVIDASVNDYHTPITTQFHVDYFYPRNSDWDLYTVNYAKQQGAISLDADAWNTFVQQRWATAISNSAWSNNTLAFDVTAGGPNQTMLVPLTANGVTLTGITKGSAVSYTTKIIDGTPYAMVPVSTGHYVATYAQDTSAPTVSSTSPASGATGISTNSAVSITFSKAMNRDSAETAFSISPNVSGSFSWDGTGTTMTFTPAAALTPQTSYTVTEGTGAKDLSGNALQQAKVWSFMTASPTPPTVTGVTPTSGPTAGGSEVTVTGTGFAAGTTVSFGTSPASNVVINSSTSLTATTPAHAAGTVDVTVTTANGTSATSAADQYTFVAPVGTPTISAVDPGTGPASGGTTVTITGTNFAPGTTVSFGGTPATNVTIVNAGTITATTPAKAAGAADVMVTANSLQATLPGGFRFVACPSNCVTDTTSASFSAGNVGASTAVGQTSDGEVMLAPMMGSEFTGSTLPTGWTATPWESGGNATFASGRATVDGALLATTSYVGSGHALDFVATFDPVMRYQHIGLGTDLTGSPWAIFSTGSAGGALYARTNSGSGLVDTQIPGNWLGSPHHFRIEWTSSSVTYFIDGSQVASHDLAVSSQMRLVASDTGVGGSVVTVDWMRLSPYAGSGTYLSRVVDGGGNTTWTSAAWTADIPPSTGLTLSMRTGNTPTPDGSWSAFSQINTSGGSLGLAGRYLQYRVSLSTTDPAQTPVLRDITLSFNASAPAAPAPTVTAISPTSGPAAGGTLVTITGTNFVAGAVVEIGGVAATNVSLVSSTSITADTPANVAGPAAVQVINPDSQIGTLSGGFTYDAPPTPAPTVTGISPSSGPTSGGALVTITGTNLTGASQVSFGGTAGTGLTVSSATSITVTSPAHAAGTVDVTVTTPGGTSATSAADQFTYLLPIGSPTVTAVDPGTTAAAGGASLTITGTNFATGATVTVGGNAATNVTVIDAARITAAVPAHAAGTVDVTIRNADGRTATLPAALTYIACGDGCVADTTAANFSAGSPGTGSYVSQSSDGELMLAPAAGVEFSGSALPSGWSVSPWGAGGAVTLSGGSATIDGALLATTSYVGAGHALDFVATFDPADHYQHIGFGTDLNGAPWAIFSTGSAGGALFARSNSGSGSPVNTQIPGSWLGSPHHFRIVWTASNVTYFIDGNQVAQQSVAITSQMRPVASDSTPGGATVTVDWMRMSPYVGSGTFLSRVFDAGAAATWANIGWTADLPSGTSLTLSVRTGDTATPNGTWSSFTPVGAPGSNLGLTGRYLQYQVSLSTSDATQAPALRDVTIGYALSSQP